MIHNLPGLGLHKPKSLVQINKTSSSGEDSSITGLDLQLDIDWTNEDVSDQETNEYLNPTFSTESDTNSETSDRNSQSSEEEEIEPVELDPKIQDQFVSLKNEICNCTPKCACEMTSQITYL